MFHPLSPLHRKIQLSTEMTIVSFLFTLALGMEITIFSIYFYEQFALEKNLIGMLNIYNMGLTVIFAALMGSLIERFHEKLLLIASSIAIAFFYIGLAFSSEFLFAFLFLTFLAFFRRLRYTTFNILYKDQSQNTPLDKKEGYLFTLINLGWFLGPFIAGLAMDIFPVEQVFIIAAFFMVIGLVMLLILNPGEPKRNEKTSLHTTHGALKIVPEYFRDRNNRIHFAASAGIHIWWAFIFTFMPIVIVENGLNKSIAGIFISLCFLPVMLNEILASKVCRKIGFRRTFLIGYALPIMMGLLAFFSEVFLDQFFVTMVLLVLGSIGFSFIEPTREIYFFERFSGRQEERYYPLFTTCNAFGLLTGMGIFTIFFSTPLHVNWAFLLLTLVLIPFLLPSTRLQENRKKQSL